MSGKVPLFILAGHRCGRDLRQSSAREPEHATGQLHWSEAQTSLDQQSTAGSPVWFTAGSHCFCSYVPDSIHPKQTMTFFISLQLLACPCNCAGFPGHFLFVLAISALIFPPRSSNNIPSVSAAVRRRVDRRVRSGGAPSAPGLPGLSRRERAASDASERARAVLITIHNLSANARA